jgi:hypothetical protein
MGKFLRAVPILGGTDYCGHVRRLKALVSFCTGFLGLDVPIKHSDERQWNHYGNVQPEVFRNANMGGCRVEYEQIHAEESLHFCQLTTSTLTD